MWGWDTGGNLRLPPNEPSTRDLSGHPNSVLCPFLSLVVPQDFGDRWHVSISSHGLSGSPQHTGPGPLVNGPSRVPTGPKWTPHTQGS